MSTTTINMSFKVAGTLTTPTSIVLSDPTAAYGVKRNDTDATVVADGTALTAAATGIYYHTFTDPAVDLIYTYWVEAVYGGQTYYSQATIAGTATSTPTALEVAYTDLLAIVGDFLGVGRSPTGTNLTRCLEILDSGYRWYLHPPPAGGRPHIWSWLSKTATITLRPYKESVATAGATVATATLTYASGLFQSHGLVAGDTVQLSLNATGTYEEGTVASVTSETVLVLAAAPAGGNGSYAFYVEEAAWQYPLPADFGSIGTQFTYGVDESYRKIKQVSWPEILAMRQQGDIGGDPAYVAIRHKTLVTTTGSRWETLFYPTPGTADVLTYGYNCEQSPLRSSTPYPLGGAGYANLLIESCLAEAELRKEDGTSSIHQGQRMQLLAAAIEYDLLNGPRFLGYMGDPGMHGERDWHTVSQTITYS